MVNIRFVLLIVAITFGAALGENIVGVITKGQKMKIRLLNGFNGICSTRPSRECMNMLKSAENLLSDLEMHFYRINMKAQEVFGVNMREKDNRLLQYAQDLLTNNRRVIEQKLKQNSKA
ncbi:hypothetical protein GE061_007761 [Apolygus lucorum]|uniref:Uncharacterized protein n=1 Tax=Apolygus lucorum TaxID=248454 RepID=A0A8S9WQD0_APOLU|nr:hypothetical protein GE061_007761 [Apolygus lucorum]